MNLIERGASQMQLDKSKDVKKVRIGQVIHAHPSNVSAFLFATANSVKGVFKKYTIHRYRNSNDKHHIALWKHVQPGGQIVEFLLDIRTTSTESMIIGKENKFQ